MNVPNNRLLRAIMVAIAGSILDRWSQLWSFEIHHHLCSEAMVSVAALSMTKHSSAKAGPFRKMQDCSDGHL